MTSILGSGSKATFLLVASLLAFGKRRDASKVGPRGKTRGGGGGPEDDWLYGRRLPPRSETDVRVEQAALTRREADLEWLYRSPRSGGSSRSPAAHQIDEASAQAALDRPEPSKLALDAEPVASVGTKGAETVASPETALVVRDAEAAAERILAQAGERSERVFHDAVVAAERVARVIEAEARRQAEALVREAEERAKTVLAEARRKSEAQGRELARQHAALDEKRSLLAELVRRALNEIKVAARDTTVVHPAAEQNGGPQSADSAPVAVHDEPERVRVGDGELA